MQPPWASSRLRPRLQGRLTQFPAGFRRLVRQRGMRHENGSDVRAARIVSRSTYNRILVTTFGGSRTVVVDDAGNLIIDSPPAFRGPPSRLAALLHVRADFSPPIRRRFPLRGSLRLSLPLSLHGRGGTKGRYRASQRGLRAFHFADIPTPLPIQNKTKEVYVMFSINLDSASLALDACANTSALVRQRFSSTSATVIALLLKTPPPQSVTGSALLPQHLAVNRPLPWGSA